ncbi:MscS mechanosensitive ion channel [Calothrix sp. NIES-4071]|nr:MscS mechanosensitive ion channel [Calothrix sp. NIES-4071]BAZ55147.1 MscS mechanosensitive ion channel [Calothrix sp. NIES-4105]
MRRNHFQIHSIIRSIALVVILGCLLLVTPVQAQTRQNSSITLDGHQLFKVSDTGQVSAENRATDANLILKQAVRSSEPVKVEIIENNQLPVIRVQGRHLLTVTSQDIPTGRTKEEQAKIWAQIITEAIQQGQQERKASYITQTILVAFVSVIGALFIHKLLGWVWQYWLRRLVPRAANDPETGAQPKGLELLLYLTLFLIRTGLWVGIIIYITDLFPLTREWSQRITSILSMSLTSPVVSLGAKSYSVINILILIGLFFGLLAVAGAVTNLLRSRILRITSISRGVQESIAVIFNYSLLFIGTVVLLQIWGLDISSLAIFASILGVAIGFGLQGVARELVSGLVVTFERSIQVGDFIEIGEHMGTVERLNARSTHIRTLDDILVIVPNSRLLEKEVKNWSHHNQASRLVLPIRVGYNSNMPQIRSALLEAAKKNSEVLHKPAPKVWVKGFGEDYLDFQLLVWISKPRRQFQIKSDLYFQIDENLRNQNIQIPLPQRSLHIRSGSLPVELSPKLEDSLSQLSAMLAIWLKNQVMIDNLNGSTNSSNNKTKENNTSN